VKVTGIETLRLPEHPELMWVVVETDDGLRGLGETMPRVGPVEAVVHDVLAPILLGGDVAPEWFWSSAFTAMSYHGYAGAELRALSALDIALWDLVGQAAGLPLHRLLGGPVRDVVPVYNTCVSHGEIRDHERFHSDAAGLARDLVSEGWPAMKVWPFDPYAPASNGQRISAADLATGLRVVAEIRDAVGDAIEIAIEGHSCWSLPSAVRIATAVEEFRPMWIEDMLQAGDPHAWASLREATSVPVCGSERLLARYGVRPFLDAGAFDIVKQDLAWTGGFTEFMKVASLAASHELPVAPHNCHGPVAAMATLHAAAALPNLYLMESVRAFTRGFFADLVDLPPELGPPGARVPERPGLGLQLRPDVAAKAARRRSDLATVSRTGWTTGDPWSGEVGDRV
jgi:galactonate dehydratase